MSKKRVSAGTALIVLSLLLLINNLCERVLVMRGGYIVESGRTEDVFNNPKEEYTQKLIKAIPKINIDTTIAE